MKKTLLALAFTSTLALSACAAPTPGPAQGYTGPATIEKSYRNSSKRGCKVVVKLPDGSTDTLSVGRRTSCTGWDAGKTVQINNGGLVR